MDIDAEFLRMRTGLAEVREAIAALGKPPAPPTQPSQDDQDIPDHGRGLFELGERVKVLEEAAQVMSDNIALAIERIMALEDAIEKLAPGAAMISAQTEAAPH